MNFLIFIVTGLIVGSIVGLSGLGAGALLTPILIFLGLNPIIAIGTDIVYAAISKTYASLFHIKEKNVDFKTALFLLLGSIPGVLSGRLFIILIQRNLGLQGLSSVLQIMLGIVLILLSMISIINTLWKSIKQKNTIPEEIEKYFKEIWEKEKEDLTMESVFSNNQVSVIVSAFIVGFFVQLVSIGSGVLITFILLSFLSPKKVVGTELFYASILLVISSIFYMQMGYVNYSVLFLILAGSIIGIPFGVLNAKRLPQHILKFLLHCIILFSGIMMLVE